ncbi:hypothetical protein LTR66_013315 [Elasticomyces elasticus]|nr:hypothetical protein LTR66_013315 [Elasticomyces elasticus]
MYSPDSAANGGVRASTRNPRRRQRRDSDSSKQQPQRKRSKLSEDTFAVPNGNVAAYANGSVDGYTNGIAERHARRSSAQPLLQNGTEIPVRGRKQAVIGKRAIKEDGSVVLTQNDYYSVKHLPSTPDFLTEGREDYKAYVSSTASLALAITRTQAIIWDYTSPKAVQPPRTFDLPNPSRGNAPIAIGALVTTSSSDIGLLVISSAGQITYWENVDSAESLNLFNQRRNAVDGSLGILFSGETVLDVLSAGLAGFVALLSSGRVAQIRLRDAQGRAQVKAQFLRADEPSAGNGLLAGIRNAFGGSSWRRDIVAVRARSFDANGTAQIIATVSRGSFMIWTVDWRGQYTYKGPIDYGDALELELKALAAPEMQSTNSGFAVLDFVDITGRKHNGTEVAKIQNSLDLNLLVLVKFGDELSDSYALVEVELREQVASIQRIIPTSTYAAVATRSWKPRLSLPATGHIAYITMGDAVVLVSIMEEDDSPEAQLRMDQHQSTVDTFQESIFFRPDKGHEVLGTGDAEGSSVIVFLKGFGIVRVTAVEKEGQRSRLPIQSKIEQAVSYGTMADNILDFSTKQGDNHSPKAIEQAALVVSNEVLRGELPYSPFISSSVETQLSNRAKALRALVRFMRQNCTMSKHCAWSLLWDAEKLAAAQVVWSLYEARLQDRHLDHKPLLTEVIEFLCIRNPDHSEGTRKERDPVRRWFLQQIERMEDFVPWTYQTMSEVYRSNPRGHQLMCQIISEADDVTLGIIDTVYKFREENAELYNIDPGELYDGVLKTGYEDLPEFWTSTAAMQKAVDHLIMLAREFAVNYYEKDDLSDKDRETVGKLSLENVRLIQCSCRIHREQIAWHLSRSDEKNQALGRNMQIAWDETRHEQLRQLANAGQTHESMALAERYRDMQALVTLVMSEKNYLSSNLADASAVERALILEQAEELDLRIRRYYDEFGDDWATALFDRHVQNRRCFSLISEADRYQGFVTRYLRAQTSRAKVGWINEVLWANDNTEDRMYSLKMAGTMLLGAARTQESMVWGKKVELSMSKLACLAIAEIPDNGIAKVPDDTFEAAKDELKIVDVQQRLYDHLKPMTFGCIDIAAEVQAVLEIYGVGIKSLPALSQLLELLIEDLVRHRAMSPEQLIDVLTLMDISHSEIADNDIAGKEFRMALDVLRNSTLKEQKVIYDTTHRLIWKRCFIRDDWAALDDTRDRTDDEIRSMLRETALFTTIYSLVEDEYFHNDNKLSPLSLLLLPPASTVGAGSSQDLKRSFPSDGVREPIARDNAEQDEQLLYYVGECRLDYWLDACKEEARIWVELTREERAEAERRLVDAEEVVVLVNGHREDRDDDDEGDEGDGVAMQG